VIERTAPALSHLRERHSIRFAQSSLISVNEVAAEEPYETTLGLTGVVARPHESDRDQSPSPRTLC
jgi:hypothetical protein